MMSTMELANCMVLLIAVVIVVRLALVAAILEALDKFNL